jgi:hypothetical protein
VTQIERGLVPDASSAGTNPYAMISLMFARINQWWAA